MIKFANYRAALVTLIAFNLISVIFITSLSQTNTKPIDRQIQKAFQNGSLTIINYPQIKFKKTLIATLDNFSDCIEIGHSRSRSRFSFSTRPSTSTSASSPCLDLSKSGGGRTLSIQDSFTGPLRLFGQLAWLQL